MASICCPKCTSLEIKDMGFNNQLWCESCHYSWINKMISDDYIRGYCEGYTDVLNTKENYKYSMFGMDLGKVLDIISNHVRKEQKSEVSNVPIGFTFDWNKRKETNEFFAKLAAQGFEVNKCP